MCARVPPQVHSLRYTEAHLWLVMTSCRESSVDITVMKSKAQDETEPP